MPKLFPTQENELFDLIDSLKLNPKDFQFENKKDGAKLIIDYRGFAFFFSIAESTQSRFIIKYFPDNYLSESELINSQDWKTLISHFKAWLAKVKGQVQVPDKWKLLSQAQSDFQFIEVPLGDHFSVEEYNMVTTKIDIFKESLKEINLTQEQYKSLSASIEELKESAKSISKKDWLLLFVGTIVTQSVALSITPENISSIWSIFKTVFTQYLLN